MTSLFSAQPQHDLTSKSDQLPGGHADVAGSTDPLAPPAPAGTIGAGTVEQRPPQVGTIGGASQTVQGTLGGATQAVQGTLQTVGQKVWTLGVQVAAAGAAAGKETYAVISDTVMPATQEKEATSPETEGQVPAFGSTADKELLKPGGTDRNIDLDRNVDLKDSTPALFPEDTHAVSDVDLTKPGSNSSSSSSSSSNSNTSNSNNLGEISPILTPEAPPTPAYVEPSKPKEATETKYPGISSSLPEAYRSSVLNAAPLGTTEAKADAPALPAGETVAEPPAEKLGTAPPTQTKPSFPAPVTHSAGAEGKGEGEKHTGLGGKIHKMVDTVKEKVHQGKGKLSGGA